MKRTFFTALLSFSLSLFIAQASYALDLGNALKQAGAPVSGDALNKEISAKIDEKLDKVVKKAEGQLDGYKTQLDGEIKKYKDQIEAEEKKIQGIIAETEESINKIRDIKNNIYHYINLVKTIVAILGSGIVILLFAVWRVWRNVVNMKNLVKNVTNYSDFDKRLKKLEAEIAKLKPQNQ